jgi:hypothetical protein
MTMTNEAPAYVPEIGHLVRVQRWEVPCPEIPGTAERKLLIEMEGTVASVRELAGGYLIKLAGDDADPIFTGYQFSGQDPDHGCSWSLRTEVIPASQVREHDQASQLAEYLKAKQAYEALVDRAAGLSRELARLIDLRDRAGARVDALKDQAEQAEPVAVGEPLCCIRYGRLHEPVFALSGCRWYSHKPAPTPTERREARRREAAECQARGEVHTFRDGGPQPV